MSLNVKRISLSCVGTFMMVNFFDFLINLFDHGGAASFKPFIGKTEQQRHVVDFNPRPKMLLGDKYLQEIFGNKAFHLMVNIC